MKRLFVILVFAFLAARHAAWAQESAPSAPAPAGSTKEVPARKKQAPATTPRQQQTPSEKKTQSVPAQKTAAGKPDAAGREQSKLYDNYERLARVMEIVESRYVEPVKSEKLFEGALSGILGSLDPYSSYIPPNVYTSFVQETEQHFSGIGVTISLEENRVKIISTLEGMPAFEAGVQPGDYITRIEGIPIRNIGAMDDIIRRLKGPGNTKVRVTFYRPLTDKEFTVTLVRRNIPIATLRGYRADAKTGKWNFMLDPKLKIGYVRVTKFGRNTASELDKAYKGLVERGLAGLIIDLRYNPGGLLDSAVAVADRFLDDGLIVRTKGRAGIRSENYARPYDTYQPPLPLVLLVNEYSASASEVLGGALQDYGRAVLVGTRTFGKGSVQNVIPLDSHGAIKLTVAYYYTPKGRLVHRIPGANEWGLDPDIVQEMTPEDQISLREEWGRVAGGQPPESLGGSGGVLDAQLARAVDILHGALLVRREKLSGEGD